MTGARVARAAAKYLGDATNFAVTYGDGLTDANLAEELEFHLAQKRYGTVLGVINKRFLLLPGLVAGFLLQHALQGWCPPVPLFRRVGVRTATEIERERYALKALRGDFQPISRSADNEQATATVLRAVGA